jgi:hypothetical protein
MFSKVFHDDIVITIIEFLEFLQNSFSETGLCLRAQTRASVRKFVLNKIRKIDNVKIIQSL